MRKKQVISERLSVREITILRDGLSYLFRNNDLLTEIGSEFGVTEERIQNDIAKLFSKLNNICEQEGHNYIVSESVTEV